MNAIDATMKASNTDVVIHVCFQGERYLPTTYVGRYYVGPISI